MRVALVCSILLAIANAVRVILMYWWNPAYDNLLVIRVSVVLGVALICIILIAQLLGSLLPIIAKKIHVDPALMSAPVISTIMDTLSILIYCGIIIAASTLLGWSL